MSVAVTNSGGTILVSDGNAVLYIQKSKVSVSTVLDPVNGASVVIRYDEDHYYQATAANFSAPTGTASEIAAAIAAFLDSGSDVNGSGTTGYIPKWTASTTLGDSLFYSGTNSIGLGTTSPDASSLLDMTSTARGFLMPRMTTVQKNAIGTPATGLLVYDSTLGLFSYYTGAAWASLDTGTNDWTQGGNAYGTTGTIGTTDTNVMSFITNNVVRMSLSASASSLTIGTAGATQGSLLLSGATSGAVTITTAGAAGTWTLTLPANDGDSGQFLQTNGSGTTSWATVTQTFWSLTGNASTVDGTNFIGTTDDIPFNIKVNNQKSGRIDNTKSNAFFGYLAGNAISTGTGNAAFGDKALGLNATTNNNTAIGVQALYNTVAASNTALGQNALFTNTSGTQSVGLGFEAGYYETGSSKLFIDNARRASEADGRIKALVYGLFDAAVANQTLRLNASVGVNTAPIASTAFSVLGFGNTSATYAEKIQNSSSTNLWAVRNDGYIDAGTSNGNLTIGIGAGFDNALLQNTLIGRNVGTSVAAGYNTAMGGSAAASLTTGTENAYFGNSAGQNGTASSYNSAFGSECLTANNSGFNTAMGRHAGINVTGASNTMIGMNSFITGVAISNSVGLGYYAGSYETASSKLFIDALDRTNEATARTSSMVYGVFSATIGTQFITFNANTTVAQGIATTGSPTAFTVTGGAHTTLTASTESIGANFNFSATKQWAAGALTTQRENLFQAPTYAFASASTITNAATVAISAAPIAGTNATLTNASALWIQAGAARFDGRVLQNQGTDVASGTNLTLAGDGNTFEITGTTQIDLILITGWRDGVVVTLVFNESVTVRHGIATSGSNVTILLAGAANFAATANDTLTLVLCSTTAGGQAWRELARTAI